MPFAVTLLVEDTAGENPNLGQEHGISFFIDWGVGAVIFDCGETSRATRNAALMRIPLEKAKLAALSHNHHDHAGGFPAMADSAALTELVTGEDFFHAKYSLDEAGPKYVGGGFEAAFLAESGIRHRVCGDRLEIGPGCWAVGHFSRTHPEETISPRFVLRRGDEFVPDPFAEEICLVLEGDDSVAVVLGCAHPGILSMVETVADRFALPVRSVWGGAHLPDASEERVRATLSGLKRLGVAEIGLCHCSGEAVAALAEADPDVSFHRLRTGDTVQT